MQTTGLATRPTPVLMNWLIGFSNRGQGVIASEDNLKGKGEVEE
jgi:hypothetical protein